MFDKIKRLGTDTAIYGISTILGRFLNFLLVPFYTNVLHPNDYGIVAYVYSLIAFANVAYSYGMESAYFKYSSTLEVGTSRQNFSTPFVSLLGSSLGFSILLSLFASPFAQAIHLPPERNSVVYYAAGILAFDTLGIIPFAALRMQRKAKKFASIKFLNIALNVGLNILLLVVFRIGVEGIFISTLVASVLTFVVLLPTIRKHFTLQFNATLLRALLKFGLPYVPAGFATMAIQVIDRPILRALTDDATVGVYQANYRLGIFMMLIVSMYDYAWRPFYFSIAKDTDAKKIFARVLTYLFLFMAAVFLLLTFFIGDLVKIKLLGHYLIHPDYWSGLDIVPVVLLGYMFLGVSTNLSAGIYIEKKTHLLPANTFVGAGVNIAANYLLIPTMGMMGAALATFLAYFVMAVMLYFMVQPVYPVRYEFARLAKITASGAAVTAAYYCLHVSSFVALFKVGLLLLFVLIMYVMKLFEPSEMQMIKRLFVRPQTPTRSPESVEISPDRHGV